MREKPITPNAIMPDFDDSQTKNKKRRRNHFDDLQAPLAPLPKQISLTRKILIVVVMILFWMLFYRFHPPDPQPPTPKTSPTLPLKNGTPH